MMFSFEDFRHQVNGKILVGEPLASYSSFKIGGKADYFFIPSTKEDLYLGIKYFKETQIPYYILGKGSNTLISDKGLQGVVVSLKKALSTFSICEENHTAEIGAGMNMPVVALNLIKLGYSGLEHLSGVPGSVGGAILMNAGAHGREIFDIIKWVDVIQDGKHMRLQKSSISYDYRSTNLEGSLILGCCIKLKKLSEEELKFTIKQRQAWIQARKKTQPLSMPNAGSIFKNPPSDSGEKKRSAGYLIEACGLKGYKMGDAEVSTIHANFIVNTGSATSQDVLSIVKLIREKVLAKFGIWLDLEVKLMGFEKKDIRYITNKTF